VSSVAWYNVGVGNRILSFQTTTIIIIIIIITFLWLSRVSLKAETETTATQDQALEAKYETKPLQTNRHQMQTILRM
jgi:hypothetical protein